jgi:hypothetical protein
LRIALPEYDEARIVEAAKRLRDEGSPSRSSSSRRPRARGSTAMRRNT